VEEPSLRTVPREQVTASLRAALQLDSFQVESSSRGRRQLLTLDLPFGGSCTFFIYFPPGYQGDARGGKSWPLLLFLHSMHSRIDGDNNVFYESDTPLRLLMGDERCPRALREDFVVVAPQCPADPERSDGGGVWLRKGWYETSSYDPAVEAMIAHLLLEVCSCCNVDRHRISVTGTSMGAYACLELANRWPGLFSAAAPVARLCC
ncbi:unnamed protein product, partial [Polarella glacialis]